MANYTMDHLIVGANTYEIVDETARSISIITDTASGAVATFEDGADSYPVESLTAEINPVQSGSGDPSPSNVRPISGWSSVHVYVGAVSGTADETYTVSLGDTYYGGTLNVTTGELTVTQALVTLTGDSVSTVGTASTGVKYASGSLSANAQAIAAMSDRYVGVTAPTASGSTGIRAVAALWYIYDDRFTNLATAKSLLDASNVQLCYTLVTPLTYTLSATEVQTLLGQNNIWADSGDVSVTYKADTKLYINKVISAL